MIPYQIEQGERNLIEKVCSLYENCRCNIIVISNEQVNIETTIHHITTTTYYRLLLHNCIPDFDKCIWLDSDTVVCADISELNNLELGDNYLAGVKAPGYRIDPDYHCRRLGLSSIEGYINAGVLVMNLRKLRDDDMENTFIDLATNKYESQDQDVLNIACYGKISLLHFRFNFQPFRVFDADEYILEVFPINEIASSYNSPAIVHFLDSVKPWQDRTYDFNDFWRNYYIDLVRILPDISGFSAVNENPVAEICRCSQIDFIKELVFYGAGARCKEMLRFFRFSGTKDPDEIWDINYDKISEVDGIRVVAPRFDDGLKRFDDLSLIICIDDKGIAEEVARLGKDAGIKDILYSKEIKRVLWSKLLADSLDMNGTN